MPTGRTVSPLAAAAIFMAVMALAACSEEQGPAEKTGEEIDEAAEELQDKAGEAAEEAGDAIEDAGDSVEDATDG